MKKFKDIKPIKINPEPAKGKNVDPSQLGQYSAKYQVSESTASLNQYLSSRGINPKFVSTATKIAHSKSAQFIKWQQDHMQRREDVQPTELTPEETVNEISMDNISPMMQAHVKKGRMGSVNVGTRMASPKPTFKPKPKPKKVGFFKRLFAGEEVQLEASKPSALDRFRAAAAAREVKHNNIEKERQERLHKEPSASNSPHRDVKKDGMSDAIRRLEKHMNKEEVGLDEGIMTGITLGQKVKNTQGGHDQDVHHKGEKIGSISSYSHRTGKRYGMWHDASGDATAGSRSSEEAISDLRQTHAQHLKDTKVKKEEVSQEKINAFHSKLDTLVHKTFGKRRAEMKMKEEIELDEQINEVLSKDASAGDWIHDFVHSKNPKFAGKSTAERKKMALGAYYGKKNEDMWQDPQAATQTPADGANGGNQVADRKRQMSKSARMIKALYKKHRVVKEDMYDHEKEDKSVATYGKKPKMSQTDKKDSLGENKPQAAATLTGGTTLTGVKRDNIEIDPIMRNRPGQPDISKKYDKKEKNKNDK